MNNHGNMSADHVSNDQKSTPQQWQRFTAPPFPLPPPPPYFSGPNWNASSSNIPFYNFPPQIPPPNFYPAIIKPPASSINEINSENIVSSEEIKNNSKCLLRNRNNNFTYREDIIEKKSSSDTNFTSIPRKMNTTRNYEKGFRKFKGGTGINSSFEYNKKLKLMSTLENCEYIDQNSMDSGDDCKNISKQPENVMKAMRNEHELGKLPGKYKQDYLEKNLTHRDFYNKNRRSYRSKQTNFSKGKVLISSKEFGDNKNPGNSSKIKHAFLKHSPEKTSKIDLKESEIDKCIANFAFGGTQIVSRTIKIDKNKLNIPSSDTEIPEKSRIASETEGLENVTKDAFDESQITQKLLQLPVNTSIAYENTVNFPSCDFVIDEELVPLVEQRAELLRLLATMNHEDNEESNNNPFDQTQVGSESHEIPTATNVFPNTNLDFTTTTSQNTKSTIVQACDSSTNYTTASTSETLNISRQFDGICGNLATNSVSTGGRKGRGKGKSRAPFNSCPPRHQDSCVRGEIIASHLSYPQLKKNCRPNNVSGNAGIGSLNFFKQSHFPRFQLNTSTIISKYKIDKRKHQYNPTTTVPDNIDTKTQGPEDLKFNISTENEPKIQPDDPGNNLLESSSNRAPPFFEEYELSTNDEEEDEDISICEDDKLCLREDEEILGLLERPVDEAVAPIIYEKSVLRAVDKDDFEVLPDKWIEITHNSGIPLYFNKMTRVCTLSRPYFLGSASVRKHSVPLGSIPCLHYKRFKAKNTENSAEISPESTGKSISDQNLGDIFGGLCPVNSKKTGVINLIDPSPTPETMIPIAALNQNSVVQASSLLPTIFQSTATSLPFPFKITVESAMDAKERNWITPAQLREYCEKLFVFHTITVRRFKTWADRRRHIKRIKSQRPSLPPTAKIVKCILPAQRFNGQIVAKKKNFYFNPEDKTVLSILHEYVQNVLKTQVSYTFHTIENSNTPFGARLSLKGVEYGIGYGSNKKNAKLEAARVALSVLNPEIAKLYNSQSKIVNPPTSPNSGTVSAVLGTNRLREFLLPTIKSSVLLDGGIQNLSECPNSHMSSGINQLEDQLLPLEESQPTIVTAPVTKNVRQSPPPPKLLPLVTCQSPLPCKLLPSVTLHSTTRRPSEPQALSVTGKTTTTLLPPINRETRVEDEEFELFNELKVTDPRIAELSLKAGQSTPYAILLECLKRNFGLTDSNIKSELKFIRQNTHLFTLTVGNYTASVYCHSKKEGKHKSAQQILQKIHPQVLNWGSILRLYGRTFTQELKDKKLEEQSITSLQNSTTSMVENSNQTPPNVQILQKLQLEMIKLHERKKFIKPIGTVFNPQSI